MSIRHVRQRFYAMKRDADPGDGMTWETYNSDLDRRIETRTRVSRTTGANRPVELPFRRKTEASARCVAALEDKMVQRAVAC